ncbi:hypothetical protein FIM10_18490 [Sphingomonadales bacterium 56]|uniref:SnoaL-like domain-containing protein n=1 Tax=Sphingobium indicum (strain DSM 16412 / CCM 7286 / MTCC 6364 / B90A) TaxID=861109 RepID=A0A1L5BRM4_SPHIB|nr:MULTISPECIES: nuclear transport factor 2 family protein [Sphingobium]MBY2930671.1 hypothetical protein [Sphingomonadales bacterium 56]MBY2960787.1 hypothetical protein [Sphingomonadales bacterium 58]APL95509.1 hypothetical protein SIDU_13865 [Sphingobium indicum B90A]CAD7341725.1 hypothetical protein SPHS6_03721 [Sphingobium sp. S6]CAD7341938.1 hypothetical protein SPHS8_03769 [Sphingobium sp. S8]
MPDLQANKDVVRRYYEMAFAGDPERAAETYAGTRYVQHNPRVADDRPGFVAFVRGLLAQFPGLSVDIKRMIAEEDLVVVHAHVLKGTADPGVAVIEIFRVEDGKVVEHWDVSEPVAATSLNANGMF